MATSPGTEITAQAPSRRIAYSYCRICGGTCGIKIEMEDDRIIKVIGDKNNPSSEGYTCVKGRHIADLIYDKDRFLQCQRRRADGSLEPMATKAAVEEVGHKLRAIIDEHGPNSVAVYWGTFANMQPANWGWVAAFLKALKTDKFFSIMSIDQAPKWVAPWRVGSWAGGNQHARDSDVWFLMGINPLMSMWSNGFGMPHGTGRFREAKARGIKLIVMDPRRSETAEFADIHLQIRPGTDATVLAAMIRVILDEDLHDKEFCEAWVKSGDLAKLRAAIEQVTPEFAARIAGVPADDIIAAARLFGTGPKGMASTGTGSNMGPHSNIVEHLTLCLNIVCGRFPREGDPVPANVMQPQAQPVAQVNSPDRPWTRGFQSRFGYGKIGAPFASGSWRQELPSMSLPDEIMEPGEDRVRALIVIGSNPAGIIPDQERTVRALKQLELLVTMEPLPVETARLAHYILAPSMWLERPEHTSGFEYMYDGPFAQYTPAVIDPPPGLWHDWQYIGGLAQAMGLTLEVNGRTYAPGDPLPSAEEYQKHMAEGGRVPLDEIKTYPHGHMFDDLEGAIVAPANDASGRFELLADDVVPEFEAAMAHDPTSVEHPFILASRRVRDTMNSTGRRMPTLAKKPYNPCFMHPDDQARVGVSEGELVRIASEHGVIVAVVGTDSKLKPGVVSITHAYGDLPGQDNDPRKFGANVGRLIPNDHLQKVVGMPRMTGFQVSLEPVREV